MSSIKLFKGVPWGSDGLNILRFPNQAAQTAYFDSLETYVPKEEINYDPRRGAVLTLQESLFDAREFNYLAWYDDNDNPLYFFIEDYEYLNDNPAVALQITEDIWQNTQFKIKINNSKVHRRHMPRWNGSQPILYPVSEGHPRSQQIKQTLQIDQKGQFGNNPNWVPILMITNKEIGLTDSISGIFYYLTFGNISGGTGTPYLGSTSDNGQQAINPFNENFPAEWAGFNQGSPEVIVGMYILPALPPELNTWNGSCFVNRGNGTVQNVATKTEAAYPRRIWKLLKTSTNWELSRSINIPKPIKNTVSGRTASPDYEPQVFAENLYSLVLTDTGGNALLTIPSDVAWQYNNMTIIFEITSMSPQLRVKIGNSNPTSPADGLEAVIPCPPIDIPQSAWLDYVRGVQTQERSILENNISSGYLQAAISTISGAGAGAAMGSLYSESFGNPKRSPAMAGAAGAAMNVISGIGSLANSYISAKTNRDNFRLNEEIIRNKASPPIGGWNAYSWWNQGINLYVMQGDDVSRDIIWSQYQYNGVIVDEYMPITLRTRYYYDFIQTQNISISGNINNAQRLYLADLFNSGVTVWHSETFTGFNYNYDNIEV